MYLYIHCFIKQWGNVQNSGEMYKTAGICKCLSDKLVSQYDHLQGIVNLTSTNVVRVLGVGNCQEVIAFHDFSQGRG